QIDGILRRAQSRTLSASRRWGPSPGCPETPHGAPIGTIVLRPREYYRITPVEIDCNASSDRTQRRLRVLEDGGHASPQNSEKSRKPAPHLSGCTSPAIEASIPRTKMRRPGDFAGTGRGSCLAKAQRQGAAAPGGENAQVFGYRSQVRTVPDR